MKPYPRHNTSARSPPISTTVVVAANPTGMDIIGHRYLRRKGATHVAVIVVFVLVTAAISALMVGDEMSLAARRRRGGGPGDGLPSITAVRGGEGSAEGYADADDDDEEDVHGARNFPRLSLLRLRESPNGVLPPPERRKGRKIQRYGDEDDGAGEFVDAPEHIGDTMPPPDISPGCAAPLHARPTCNSVHEIDFGRGLASDLLRKVSKGAVRNVWSVHESHRGFSDVASLHESGAAPFVLKTLRWTRNFLPIIYQKQIRETVALDFLSSSRGTMDIYGHCGMSTATAYAEGGNLIDYIRRKIRVMRSSNISPEESLTIAARLSRAVADLQESRRISEVGGVQHENTELQVVHRDIGASNVLVGGDKPHMRVVLDDFNQAYVLRKYAVNAKSNNSTCTYRDLFVCGEDGRRPDVS